MENPTFKVSSEPLKKFDGATARPIKMDVPIEINLSREELALLEEALHDHRADLLHPMPRLASDTEWEAWKVLTRQLRRLCYETRFDVVTIAEALAAGVPENVIRECSVLETQGTPWLLRSIIQHARSMTFTSYQDAIFKGLCPRLHRSFWSRCKAWYKNMRKEFDPTAVGGCRPHCEGDCRYNLWRVCDVCGQPLWERLRLAPRQKGV